MSINLSDLVVQIISSSVPFLYFTLNFKRLNHYEKISWLLETLLMLWKLGLFAREILGEVVSQVGYTIEDVELE